MGEEMESFYQNRIVAIRNTDMHVSRSANKKQKIIWGHLPFRAHPYILRWVYCLLWHDVL